MFAAIAGTIATKATRIVASIENLTGAPSLNLDQATQPELEIHPPVSHLPPSR
jgi:hypothetical protein